MVQVYAVGRIMKRREIIGYKLLNLDDLSLKDYKLEKIVELLKKGNTIGNLYYSTDEGCVKEYFCERTLTEYTQNGRRIGKGRDTFLTVYTDSCSAGLSHYHSSEVYYSRDGLVEIKDMLNLNYIEHYDVDNLSECMPFMNDEPIDMYVKNFKSYYNKISKSAQYQESGINLSLSDMGMLRAIISKPLDEFKIDFCRALEQIELVEDGEIKSVVVSDACGAVLPFCFTNMKLDSVVLGSSSICSKSFENCDIEVVDLRNIHRNSRDDIFKNCRVEHLILPKWYDSWKILDCFKDKIEVLELTNTACTNSIWEIAVKDKLWFRRVDTLLLPVNFDFEQEKTLKEELVDVNVLRRSE